MVSVAVHLLFLRSLLYQVLQQSIAKLFSNTETPQAAIYTLKVSFDPSQSWIKPKPMWIMHQVLPPLSLSTTTLIENQPCILGSICNIQYVYLK